MNLLPGQFKDGVVALGDTVLPLHSQAGETRRPVLVGLRPEHLEQTADGPLSVRVELLERLGADTILHGRLAGTDTPLIVRTAGTLGRQLGETVRFAIRPEYLYLFDADNGRRL
jgi:sn-glycerol 3-phosphate transport system ATP-binding protein